MFTSKNAVVLALSQVGVIVAGILACGASHKAWTQSGLPLPPATSFLLQSGVLLLMLPLVWIIVAMVVRQKPTISDEARQLAFGVGILLLIGLVAFEGYGILSPWIGVLKAGFGRTMEVE